MTRWLNEREQHAWRSFLTASRQLQAHLARQLQADAELSMADFEVLVRLSEADDGRLRAFELGRALDWEKSRLSHHLRRMESRDLVTRLDCGTDRRGAFVVLTGTGREAVEAAAPTHVEAVRRAVFDVLGPEQIDALGAACDQLLAALTPPDPCEPEPALPAVRHRPHG